MSTRRDRGPGRLWIDVQHTAHESTRHSLVLRFPMPPGLRAHLADFFPSACVTTDAVGREELRVLLERDGDRRAWGAPPEPAASGGRTFEHVVADPRLHEAVRTRVATQLAVTYWGKATPAHVRAVLAAASAAEKREAAIRDDAGESAFARWLRKRAEDIYRGRARKVVSIAAPQSPEAGRPRRGRAPWRRPRRPRDHETDSG
jgi:hypothetical protein